MSEAPKQMWDSAAISSLRFWNNRGTGSPAEKTRQLNLAIDEIERLQSADLTRQAPKVKALEWGALSTPEWEKAGIAVRIAKTFFGEYRIRSIPRNGEHIWNGPFSSSESCADYVDAKAAAQADYERRILSALDE